MADLYDETTHSIAGGAEALRNYAEQQYEVASSANEVKRQGEALEAYNEKAEKYTELLQNQALAWAELQDAEKEYYALVDSGASAEELTYSKQYERLMAADEAYSEVSKAVQECNGHLEKYAYITDDAVAASEALNAAIEGASEKADAEAQAVDKLKSTLQLYDQEAQAIVDDFNAALETAKANVENVFGGTFEGKLMPDAQGMETTLSNLDEQMEYAERYIENLQKVQDMGLSDEIIKQLSDGSSQSAAILAGIVESNGAQIDELNAKYESVQVAKEQMATAMAEASADVNDRAEEVVQAIENMVDGADQSSGAYTAAANTIQGMIDGINGKLGTLTSKVAEVNALNAQLAGGGGGDGSHAAGLSYVPFDGYMAQLHRGEMVLTALEARAYRAEQYANYGMMQSMEPQTTNPNVKGISPTLAKDIASGVGAVMTQAVAQIASRPTVLRVDGKTLAEAMADDEAAAQNKRNRRFARGYGAGR